jgi:putative membrane protein
MRRDFVCVASLAIGTCVWLTWPTRAQQERKGQPLSDQRFVMQASMDGLTEVNLANLAMKNAANGEVKLFARRMLEDHTKANKELNRIADSKAIRPAAQMDKKHRALTDKLATLHGADFDQEYVKHLISDHKEAVALFQREAKEGQDPDLKKFAADTLPILREHLKQARKIAGLKEEDGKSKDHSGS